MKKMRMNFRVNSLVDFARILNLFSASESSRTTVDQTSILRNKTTGNIYYTEYAYGEAPRSNHFTNEKCLDVFGINIDNFLKKHVAPNVIEDIEFNRRLKNSKNAQYRKRKKENDIKIEQEKIERSLKKTEIYDPPCEPELDESPF